MAWVSPSSPAWGAIYGPRTEMLSIAPPQARGYLNHSLVKDGRCWWYRKYAPGETVLEGLEKEAREVRKGLWVHPAPIPP